MAKAAGFQAKIAKGSSERAGRVCPKCDQPIQVIKLVTSEKFDAKNSYKFNQRFVDVCKCNEAEVYA